MEEAVFLRRVNRFAIFAELPGGKEVYCRCPNPGKLMEILLPGTKVILEKNRGESFSRKTEYTLAAAYHRDKIVPLYSPRANKAAEKLLLPLLFSGAREIKREYSLGSSRFDFFCP